MTKTTMMTMTRRMKMKTRKISTRKQIQKLMSRDNCQSRTCVKALGTPGEHCRMYDSLSNNVQSFAREHIKFGAFELAL